MKSEDLRKKLDSRFPQTIFTGNEIQGMKVPRLPSGSFIFDMLTSGGIPKNRISVFHGPKSSGKSTFALRVAGQYQKLHPDKKVLLVDFEQTFDWDWGLNFINTEQTIYTRPDYGEQGIDITKAYAEEAEDVGLIILDSLAGIIATKEAEADAADFTQIGLQVRLVNRLIRILIPRMSQAHKRGGELTVLAINQIRANMNKGPSGYGPMYSQPCGKFLEHAASLDVRFYSGDYTVQAGVPYKGKFKFTVDKNKVGLPKRSGELTYYVADMGNYRIGEMDEEKWVVTYAKRAGVVVREGNKWIIPTKKGDPPTFGSMAELLKFLKDEPKYFEAVKKATLTAVLKNPFLTAEEEGS